MHSSQHASAPPPLKTPTWPPAGNKVSDILQLVQALAPQFQQTVLLGYPPFLKGVVDAGGATADSCLRRHLAAVTSSLLMLASLPLLLPSQLLPAAHASVGGDAAPCRASPVCVCERRGGGGGALACLPQAGVPGWGGV